MGPNYREVAQQVRYQKSSSSEDEISENEPLHSDGEDGVPGARPAALDHDLVSTAQAAQDALRSFNAVYSSASGLDSLDHSHQEAENRQTSKRQESELKHHEPSTSHERAEKAPIELKTNDLAVPSPDQSHVVAVSERNEDPLRRPREDHARESDFVKSPDLRLHPISFPQDSHEHAASSRQNNRPRQSLPPLRQLTQLAEAAEQEAIDGGRKKGGNHNGLAFQSNGTTTAHQSTGAATPFSTQDRRIPNQYNPPHNSQAYRAQSDPRRSSSDFGRSHTPSHGGYHETPPRTNGYGQIRETAKTSSPSQHASSGSHNAGAYHFYHERRASQASDHALNAYSIAYHAEPQSSTTTSSPADPRHDLDRYSMNASHGSSNYRMGTEGDAGGSLRYGHSLGGTSLGFRCNYPGCTAPPFQTQYLLNSHATVHSQLRPHFCPVANCPRGVGGLGFKRKNEMIRHGLVHGSPGYRCPFCPDREHKYPRPDNLQRHVRVHHIDKDRDDPQLREVLAQRPEGGSRGRRRRLGG